MMNVANRGCIRLLSRKALAAARTRNIVAVLAIALTSILFTSLFTIAAALSASTEQYNFRIAGGDVHASVKNITWEQVEELRGDPALAHAGARLFLGYPTDPPFNKTHVEVSYMEPEEAPHYFCTPTTGALPAEGTDEAACDKLVLDLLGVEPRIGAQFTLDFSIDSETGQPTRVSRTFTLSGWWEHDPVSTASQVLVPRSAAEEIAALSNGDPATPTGKWTLGVMFRSSAHIADDLDALLERHGMQTTDPAAGGYVDSGVNWGYTGAQMAGSGDIQTVVILAAVLVLILITGYLIIYNVFQISVANDIRFYGLLKTIGTTARQLRRILLYQALWLSLAGIPLGLVLGYAAGNLLLPFCVGAVNPDLRVLVRFEPRAFAAAAAFSLFTVLLSCARPVRLAGRVSPVEALRYTEASPRRLRAQKRRAAGGKGFLPAMAWANLGRSKGRTAVTVLSLALAVVLLELTWTFTSGFDMEKYLRDRAAADYILASGDYFQSNYRFAENILPEQAVADVQARGTVTEGGRVYGSVTTIWDAVDESWYREAWTDAYAANGQLELLEEQIATRPRSDDGKLYTPIELYGMEDFPRSRLTVIDGDLAPLADPAQNAIAAVYTTDDYDNVQPGSAWAQVGDTVTLRYVQATEAYYTDTGETIPDAADWALVEASGRPYSMRATEYRDVTYTVCAAVTVPSTLSFRYVGGDQFLLNGDRFVQDTGTAATMCYAFNTTAESNAAMEDYLEEYTGSIDPTLDYESKQGYAAEFEGLRGMFTVVGCALAFVIGLVGVLNFLNAILTGIITRRREFAVLQAVGMTGRQLKTMLIFEGLGYTLLALLLALAVSAAAGPLVGPAVEKLFWFFTYRFTAAPLLALLPVFLLLGCVVPLASYRAAARQTVVERLRAAE